MTRMSTLTQSIYFIQISPILLVFIFVNLILYNFITCVHSTIKVKSQGPPPGQTFITTPASLFVPPPPQVPNPSWLPICSPFLKFCHFKMLWKWNNIVCNLWGLTFWLRIILWRFMQIVAWLNNVFFFLLPSGFPLYGGTRVYLTIYPLKDVWAASSLRLLQIKLIWIFIYRFLYEAVFIFPEQMSKSTVVCNRVFSFIRNWETVLQSAYTILHSHQWCAWVI